MNLPDSVRNFKASHALPLIALAIALAWLWAAPALALIMVGRGNDPVHDNNWPAGSLEVANLKTRVGWWEGPPFGGGEHTFLYRGDAAAFQAALDDFAKIKAPKLELFVHDGGPAESGFLRDQKDPKSDTHYDWSFTVWNPQSWNHLYNTPGSQFFANDPSGAFGQGVAPPRLDAFVSDGKGGKGIDFAKVKVPAGVSVTDERADVAGFAGGSAVVGDVYAMTTSKPVAGAKIALAHEKVYRVWEEPAATATSDAAGHFELKGAPKGSFGVLASAPGYAQRLLGYVELRGDTLKRFAVQLSPAATLSGTALDTDNKPVVGATVRADSITSVDGRGYLPPEGAQTKTDDKGHFELTSLPRGHVQLYAYAEHYAPLDVLKIHSVPEDGLTIRLTATGAIKGRVLDKAGKPAQHGNVSIDADVPGRERIGKWGASGNTDADGSFHFENVPPGRYVVTAMATNPGPALQGKDPNAKVIMVKAGETAEVDVTGR